MAENFTQPPAENVVDLTDALARKYKPKECNHDRLEVDEANRQITCKDCNREVEPFQAVLRMADIASEWQSRWDAMRKDWRNLAGYVPRLRAVRELESMWSGNRLPMCPHCKKGVAAEALSRMGWVHKGYAEAVAQHERESAGELAAPVAIRTEPRP